MPSISTRTRSPGLSHMRRLRVKPTPSGRPGRDDVSGLEGHEARQERDDALDGEDHIGGRGVLKHLTVHQRSDSQRVESVDLIKQHELWTTGSKRVNRLASRPLGRLNWRSRAVTSIKRHHTAQVLARLLRP